MNTTRRTALSAGIAAGLAGLVTANAHAAAGPDAGIIRASAERCALEKDLDALHARRTTLEAERETADEFRALTDRIRAAERRMEDLGPPVTLAGAVALSHAALADAVRDPDGDIPCEAFAEWAAFTVVEWVEQHGGGMA